MLCPLLAYKVPVFDFLLISELCIMVLVVDYLSNNNLKVNIKGIRTLGCFFIYAVVVTLINLIISKYPPNLKDTTFYLIRFLFYIVSVGTVCRRYFDKDLAASLIVHLSNSASIIVIFQQTIYKFTGKKLYIEVPFLVHESGNVRKFANEYRTGGIFNEPADFCHFAIFALVILMFYDEKKEGEILHRIKVISIILCTIAIALSTSGTGVYLMFMVYACYIPLWIKKTSKKNLMKKVVTASFVIFLAIPLVVSNANFIDALQRGNITKIEQGSGNDRVVKGFELYSKLPLEHKILGTGYSNGMAYANSSNMFLSSNKFGSNYINGMAIQLTGTGIVGFIIYLGTFLELFIVSRSRFDRMTILVFFISGFFSGITKGYYIMFVYALTLPKDEM